MNLAMWYRLSEPPDSKINIVHDQYAFSCEQQYANQGILSKKGVILQQKKGISRVERPIKHYRAVSKRELQNALLTLDAGKV